ncbi:hypothetical protein GCM10027440_14240 [Nocardiopsis coralliicola]
MVLALSLLGFVYRHSAAHGGDLILAAMAVYVLLGGVFAAGYAALDTAAPGSFTDGTAGGGGTTWQQLTYFSYVTMATVGFGDVLPVGSWARSLAALEAVAASLFLTTVIARLVGAYMRPAPAGEPPARQR